MEYPKTSPQTLVDLRNEAEQLVKLRFNHAGIVVCSILLEATLKELINQKTGEDTAKMRFNSAIDKCRVAGLITEKEFKWLKNVNSLVRNNYIHFNVDQLLKYLKLDGQQVSKHAVKKEIDKLIVDQLFKDVDEFVYEKLVNNFK